MGERGEGGLEVDPRERPSLAATAASCTPAQITKSTWGCLHSVRHLAHLSTERGEEDKDRKDEQRREDAVPRNPAGSHSWHILPAWVPTQGPKEEAGTRG